MQDMTEQQIMESLAPMLVAFIGMSELDARNVSATLLAAVDAHPSDSVGSVSVDLVEIAGMDDVIGAHDALVKIAGGIVSLGDAMADHNRAAPAD